MSETELEMSETERLKEMVTRFRDMGRAEAERAVTAGDDIDLAHLDTRPIWALVHGEVGKLTKDVDGMALLAAAAQAALFKDMWEAFTARLVELHKH